MVNKILNKLKWTKKLKNCEIIILHRGAPGDMKVISGSKVTEVKKSYFMYEDEGRETFIPLHRVIEVRSGGKKIWEKKQDEREQ